MIYGTIKRYTLPHLRKLLGIWVIKKGIQTKAGTALNGRLVLYTNKLDNLDIHTSNGLCIKSLETNWYFQDSPMRTRVTYTSSVHPGDINTTTITKLNKQTIWEILNNIV